MIASLLNFSLRNAKLFLSLIILFTTTVSIAQGPVAGYDYLGACSGHNYYISQAYVSGVQISAVVADFQSKTPTPANQVYAAAIVNGAENACITNLMLAYNNTKFPGISKSIAQDWNNPHNAWIGFTDVAVEGTFIWSNGQASCENYTNWNIGEPNNYNGSFSNGEDFAELLIMNPYLYLGSTNDPLGKWNDWFNTNTSLPVIIEIGTADCQVARGNNGCSHGYWKNAADKAWTDAGFLRTAIFSTVFGITNGRNVITIGTTTLQKGLELNGGGYNQVAKQGVGALLNAGHGFFPYTTTEIKNAVQSMFNTGSAMLPAITVNGKNYTGGTFTNANDLASYLDILNNLGCPLNHAGFATSSSSGENLSISDVGILSAQKQFSISGYPNPSTTGFSIKVNGLSNEKVSVRVTDIMGRLIEQRNNLFPNQLLHIGNTFPAGIYRLDVLQGSNKQQLKLIKQ